MSRDNVSRETMPLFHAGADVLDGMSEKTAEKEAKRQAVLFQEECKGGATSSGAIKFDTFF